MPEKLYLIDGSNHAFRVFHAMPRNMFADGFPTGALLGFANMLRKLERDHEPSSIVVVFDKGPSFRVDLYPDYKGHRPSMPDELREQWPHFQELVEAWGCPYLAIEGIEADDIMGTLATRLASDEREVVLVTGDKDFYQLVGPNVRVYDVMKDKWIDRAEVIERMGVPPERIIDLKGLAGDSSDNIPGVPGVGEKTAAKYLQKYGTIEEVIANAKDIGGKRGAAVEEFAEQARLSAKLATILLDAEQVTLGVEDLQRHERDVKTLRQLFMKWQFRTHLKELQEVEVAAQSEINAEAWTSVSSLAELGVVVSALQEAGEVSTPVSLDLQFTSADLNTCEIQAAGLSWGEDKAAWVQGIPSAELLDALRGVLENARIPKTGHNLKDAVRVLARLGVTLRGIAGDTMLADYLLEPGRNKHGLEDLSLRYLGHTLGSAARPQEGGESQGELFGGASEDTSAKAESAQLSWLLDRDLARRMEERCVAGMLHDIELPLVPILAEMEALGVRVDVDVLQSMSAEYSARAKVVEQQAYDAVGHSFNLGSTKDLRQVLFEELDLPVIKKTPKGAPSTDHSVLEQLAGDHELPRLIVEHRSLVKLQNTYLDALPQAVHPETGRIHTTLHQEVAETGRLSSANPNLQNIPIRSAEGRRIRAAFIPADGYSFLSCDYSQVELRLLAHFAGPGALRDAFGKGQDIHARTASEIFGVELDAVEKDQRSAAKAINFGLIYGMAPPRLARELGIERKEAEAYIERYFERMPEVLAFKEGAIESAKELGYARTLWGRRRTLSELGSRNWGARAAAERLAVNTPIQGSAADLIKLAMVAVHKRLQRDAPEVRMLLQIHDELLFEVPIGQEEQVAALVREEMEGAAPLAVPLHVDAGWGADWNAAH